MRKNFCIIFLCLVSIVADAQDTTRLSLLFLGDIMQHDSQIADAYDRSSGTYNYFPCFQYAKPYIQAVDLAIANLEVTLAGPPFKGYPQFSAPDQLLTAIQDLGLDILVTANNHCVDRSREGLERTINQLDSVHMLHTGTFKTQAGKDQSHPLIIKKSGFKLALLNYTYGTNGLPVIQPNVVNILDTAAVRKDLIKARALNPDAIIVFTHWGIEYESLPSATQKMFTDLCFRYGTRLVIGSHPHVVQPMEWRKNDDQLVVYSLGNFVSGQRKRYTDGGAMVRVELQKVQFPDGSSNTAIDTAGYILQWVYRTNDEKKDYYVLPVPGVEGRPSRLIQDTASLHAFETFVTDSRSLYRKYNVNMEELNSAPDFNVEFSASDTVAVRKYLESHSSIHHIIDTFYPTIRVGPFTQVDALHLYLKIKSDLPVEGLHIQKD
jgi:poly-gamma-glutamate capsule biosynthesis protein CapA/YwtB (metallophosphatase superfamily)